MATAIAVTCQALPVQAQISDWTNTASSNAWYHQSSNWNPLGAPGPTGTARFQQPGTYQVWWNSVTAGSVPTVGRLEVLHGNVSLQNTDISPQHEITINGSGGGGSGFDDFSIRGEGALTLRGLHLRNLGNAQLFTGGTLTLDGSHSAGTRMSVEGSNGFRVLGNSVNVLAGAVLNSTKSILHEGTATVSGNGSQWNNSNALRVGDGDSGFGGPHNFTLNVTSGGLVTSLSGSIGKQANGTVNVNGIGSRWNNGGTLFVGESSLNGALNIQAGGQVISGGNGVIAVSNFSTGTVVVNGAGSKWTNGGFTYVGFAGGGTLSVEAGGEVVNTDGSVGVNFGGTGTATVSGAGSKWTNSRFLYVGNSGIGTLNVTAGGQVTNTDAVIGRFAGSLGTATVTGAGSKWTNSGSLVVGSSGGGTLNVQAGGLVTNTDGVIGQFSGSQGSSAK